MALELQQRNVKAGYEQDEITYFKPVWRGRCDDCGESRVSSQRIYTPDFTVYSNENGDRGRFYIEVKGKFTGEMRSKILQVIKSNPGIDLRMYFSKDNWLTKRHATKYSDWCERHNIPYAIGELPDEWFEDGDRL